MADSFTKKCPTLPWMIDFYSTNKGTVLNSQLKASNANRSIDHKTELSVFSQVPPYRLTQIMCTLGPTDNSVETLEALLAAGMSIIRLKMSYYDNEECLNIINMIRQANDKYSKSIKRVYPLAIAVEIKGPEIRIGKLKDPLQKEIELKTGNTTKLTIDPTYEEHVSEDMIYVDYQKINEILEPGDHIHLGDVTLSALEIVGSIIKCLIEKAGKIGSATKVSIPSIPTDLPPLSERDLTDLKFAVEQKVNIIIITSVKNAEGLKFVKNTLGEEGKGILLFAKIENMHAVENIDEIIRECDGIIISRTSLSVALIREKVFLAQKSIIAKCNKAGVPVVCTSQVLKSMEECIIPSKPDISDVANSILDGADCICLSQNVAAGKFATDAIDVLHNICKEAESSVHQKQIFSDLTDTDIPIESTYAVAISAVEASIKTGASVIVLCTTTGRSSTVIARYRPRCPIIAITRFAHVAQKLQAYRGIFPILYVKPAKANWKEDTAKRLQLGITFGKHSGFIRAGDAIIVLTGEYQGSGFTNCMKIFYASEYDTTDIKI